MDTPGWISRSVSRLRPPNSHSAQGKAGDTARTNAAPNSAKLNKEASAGESKVTPSGQAVRSMRERLDGTLRHTEEALSPRVLRRTLHELQAIVDSQLSEIEAGKRAKGVAGWYARATPEERRDCWILMSEQFAPDPAKLKQAREQYEAALGTSEEGAAEVKLRKAFYSPRTRLLQRFAVFPEGMRFLVDLRAEMLPELKSDKRLLALDAELEALFSTWFDVAFLELRRISWDSPASLIEKLIKYEAVHDIRSWADLKNRLDSDRRCYGFFHPRLPDEPLIFVEVALLDEMAGAVTPLLDESGAVADLNKATHAIFYSISNTQPGLKGVSFGDSLIKRVVDTLRADFPRLKTFVTLSPIPGLRAWSGKNAARLLERLSDKERRELGRAVGFEPPGVEHFLSAADKPQNLDAKSPVRRMLMRCAAQYLSKELVDNKPIDPVARFHLGNGARVERINWAGDLSNKGIKQSFGLMVNYLYDLKRINKHRQQLANGHIPASGDVTDLHF